MPTQREVELRKCTSLDGVALVVELKVRPAPPEPPSAVLVVDVDCPDGAGDGGCCFAPPDASPNHPPKSEPTPDAGALGLGTGEAAGVVG